MRLWFGNIAPNWLTVRPLSCNIYQAALIWSPSLIRNVSQCKFRSALVIFAHTLYYRCDEWHDINTNQSYYYIVVMNIHYKILVCLQCIRNYSHWANQSTSKFLYETYYNGAWLCLKHGSLLKILLGDL